MPCELLCNVSQKGLYNRSSRSKLSSLMERPFIFMDWKDEEDALSLKERKRNYFTLKITFWWWKMMQAIISTRPLFTI